MIRLGLLLALACGCGGSDSSDADADSDSDADSDGDTDADTDTDTASETDSDSETGTETGTGSETDDPCAAPDADGDGHDRTACGGDDCNDADAFIHPGAPDFAPEIDTVEIGTPSARPSLALAPDGTPHVAFQDADDVGQYDLRIGSLEDAGWDVDTFVRDRNVGNSIALAVDGDGALHVAYTDSDALTIRYGTNASGAWVHETVVDGGGPVDLALDDAGFAHVTWVGGVDGDVVHVTNETAEWLPTTVDSVGWSSGRAAIAIAPDGTIHVVSWNGDVRWSTDASGAWAVESIVTETGDGPDVAVGEDGAVHVAYPLGGGSFDLWTVTNATGEWVSEPVDEDGGAFDVSIALDPAGHRHLGYSVLGEEALRYATDAPGAFTIEIVDDEGWTGRNPSLATDGLVVRVAYLDVDAGAIQHAVFAPIDGIDQDCDGDAR